jgi:DNA-binding GntR family transcriptional regulator
MPYTACDVPLPNPEPLSRTSARDAAYRQLREWIMFGPLEPGEPISDTELAALLGVSRTPVREALARLAQEGLVETQAGRRTRVAQLRLHLAPHLFAVGGVLDAFAAEQAAARLSDVELGALDRVLAEMGALTDSRELQLLDERFHAIYYEAAGNPPLAEMLEGIAVELRRFDRVGFRNADVLRAAYQEHAAILEAFRHSDAHQAAAAARRNWTESWARIERILASGPRPQDPVDVGAATTDEGRESRNGGRKIVTGSGGAP